MEYIIFIAVIGLLMLVLFLKGAWDSHRQKIRFIERLYKDYGKKPEREYKAERFLRIDSYFRKHPEEGQLDDITWNDLNMDTIFKRMNGTLSSTGEEYLYYTLRTPVASKERLLHQEELVTYFTAHPDDRVKLQLLSKELGTTGDYSLYDYLDHLELLGKRSNWKILLVDALFVLALFCCGFQPSLGLAAMAVLAVYQITTYFKVKKEIEPYIISFTYVMRLIEVSRKMTKLTIPECSEEWERIRAALAELGKMRRGAGWVLSGFSPTVSGNPLEILMDYVNMVFHLDIMMFHHMLSELNRHLPEVDILVSQAGAIETAICIGAFRTGAENGWCRPDFTEGEQLGITVREAYHPLLEHPVKNSISTKKGVLLTGSNASGKSTFLKTVALNAILAQTIYTCTADAYFAPFYRICSSMALRDDIGSGESYYIVEIKALKRILEINGELPVLCFVDEVLRGTNTVERIAASTQILKSLSGKKILCFAATHDIELTELLKEDYENCHFEEEIRDGDIFFNYRLMDGKATTRNAIRLLELIGYDTEIISRANEMAERFLQSGSWVL